jgi:ammonium transporter, Amt family
LSGPGGRWFSRLCAIYFVFSTVVHVNAGVAALVVCKRHEYPSSSLLPHNVPFVLLGAGVLWFGWFGFNAGSALAAGNSAALALAFTTTFLAPMGTLVVWTLLDYTRSGKPTAVGAATAIVVGLVAITPAAGFICQMSAIILGAIAAVPSYFGLSCGPGHRSTTRSTSWRPMDCCSVIPASSPPRRSLSAPLSSTARSHDNESLEGNHPPR